MQSPLGANSAVRSTSALQTSSRILSAARQSGRQQIGCLLDVFHRDYNQTCKAITEACFGQRSHTLPIRLHDAEHAVWLVGGSILLASQWQAVRPHPPRALLGFSSRHLLVSEAQVVQVVERLLGRTWRRWASRRACRDALCCLVCVIRVSRCQPDLNSSRYLQRSCLPCSASSTLRRWQERGGDGWQHGGGMLASEPGMNINIPIRGQPVAPSTALSPKGETTLDDVMARLITNPSLSNTRKRDLVSSLRRVSSVLRLEPAQVPADAVWLRARLAKFEPALLGLKAKTWANVVSNALSALTEAGVTRRGWSQYPMSDEWQRLWERIEDNRQPEPR